MAMPNDDIAAVVGPTETRGAIALIAKCPIPGKSKTRLIPLLGPDGSTSLAKAMLSDVVLTLDKCETLDDVKKILFYAPGNDDGLKQMTEILQNDLGVRVTTSSVTSNENKGWELLPLISKTDLQASDLGDLLEYALERARQFTAGCVVFLGMDSPVLPLNDIVTGLEESQKENPHALLCPADDGGYGMLSVPPDARSSQTFRKILWSHSLTAFSQLKALTDFGIEVKIGELMHDIDEPDDVKALCKRLMSKNDENPDKVLYSSAAQRTVRVVVSVHPECLHTRKALVEAGQITSC